MLSAFGTSPQENETIQSRNKSNYYNVVQQRTFFEAIRTAKSKLFKSEMVYGDMQAIL